MATTSIWAVKSYLDYTINYGANPEKTLNPKYAETDFQTITEVIEYAADEDKTEMQYFVTAINCDIETAYQEFIITKKRWGKEDKILAFHAYQSFAPNETTPEIAHQIGVEFAQRLWGTRFEVTVSTHLNTKCLHNHFVLNSVSFIDGHKYYDNLKTKRELRRESDELCRKYHLSVIENPKKGRRMHYAQWQAENENKPTWRSAIRNDIDNAIKASMSWSGFIQNLKNIGYEIKTDRKYMTLRPPDKERPVRLYKLGDNYTPEAINERILNQNKPEHLPKLKQPVIKKTAKVYGNFKLNKVTVQGLRALYFYYRHKLRQAQKRPNEHYPYQLRDELKNLDSISKQATFLFKYKLNNSGELLSHKEKSQSIISNLLDERKLLKNEKRCVNVSDSRAEQIDKRLGEITEALKTLRGEVKLCDDILIRSVVLREKATMSEKTKDMEVKKHEPSRRCRRTDRGYGN